MAAQMRAIAAVRDADTNLLVGLKIGVVRFTPVGIGDMRADFYPEDGSREMRVPIPYEGAFEPLLEDLDGQTLYRISHTFFAAKRDIYTITFDPEENR